MKKYLLPQDGQFYKANLHCHSTYSDGAMTPEEIKKLYKDNGYSIIAFTDHDILIPHPELADDDFLPLNGYEMEINESYVEAFNVVKCCHMCLIALKPDNLTQVCYHRTNYLFGNAPKYRELVKYDEALPDYVRKYTHEGISEMMRLGREGGFFVTYNHPAWSLEDYSDYIGYNNMNAMEISNYVCIVAGYPDYNEKEYDDMLRAGKRIYCIAADDNHNDYNSCGSFTMINANKLEYQAVTDSLVNGKFYSSEGPLIHELWFEDGTLYVRCSEAASIRMNTGSRNSKMKRNLDGSAVTEASFSVKKEYGYVRITVTDRQGRHANTNAYFTDELF